MEIKKKLERTEGRGSRVNLTANGRHFSASPNPMGKSLENGQA
jgi:hypothetical protein